MTILSFGFTSDRLVSTVVILSISAALVAATVLLYRGIDRRWSRESFAF